MSTSSVRLDRRGVAWGVVAVAMVLAMSFIGSDRLVWFDAALSNGTGITHRQRDQAHPLLPRLFAERDVVRTQWQPTAGDSGMSDVGELHDAFFEEAGDSRVENEAS